MGGHGGGDDTGHVEPNLTPMLDLVLQILMFFIATTTLKSAQDKQTVVLPTAPNATEVGESTSELLVLNITYDEDLSKKYQKPVHLLSILGKEDRPVDAKPSDPGDTRLMLENIYKIIERDNNGKVDVIVVIRADINANYVAVFNIFKMCQDVGFSKFSVRGYK